MNRLAKAAVALVATLGLLAWIAAPGSATTGPITGGTSSVNLTPASALDLDPTVGGCASSTITMTDNSSGTLDSQDLHGTITITAHAKLLYNSVNYVFSLSATGTYTSTHAHEDSGYTLAIHSVAMGGQIRAASATDPCASTGTSKCSSIAAASINHSGVANLTKAHPPEGSVQITGSGTIAAFGCSAPFSSLNGKTLSFTSLTATLP